MTADDLILVNKDGKVVEGGQIRLLNASGDLPNAKTVVRLAVEANY